MAAQSKSSDAAPPENPLKILGPATFLSVFCFCTTLASRPMMIARIMGDPALASSTLARLTASGALSEFVFSPVFGRLMDKYGRKPFLVGALLVSAAANGALFLNTDSLQFFLLEAIFRKAADTVYFNAMRASMSDVVRGKELTISASKIATYAGVGVMCGPIFTQRIMIPLLGGAVEMSRYAFAINVGTLSVAALWIASRLREPLAKDQRKPMNWITCNPFNFLAMLTKSRSMFFLMVTSGLQTILDGYNIVESNFMYQRDQLNFSQAEQANYLTFAGVKIIIGGLLGKPLMGKLGQLGLTTFSNAVNFCAQAIGMLATGPLGMYAHVLATGIGERKRDGVETLLTAEAVRHGFGKGEVSASMSNWRSLPNIGAPLLYAAVYNWGAQPSVNFPKALFLSRMILGAIIPEITFRCIPTKERQRLSTDS